MLGNGPIAAAPIASGGTLQAASNQSPIPPVPTSTAALRIVRVQPDKYSVVHLSS